MELLQGKKIAQKILDNLRENIEKEDLTAGLGVILVGKNEASRIYVSLKEKAAREIGIKFQKFEFEENVPENVVLQKISELNRDRNIDGIIVQLPLPAHLDKNKIIESIDPKKDADGFHPENMKLFFEHRERLFPVLPKSIFEFLKEAGSDMDGKSAAVICNSPEFGKTMEFALQEKGILADYILKEEIEKNTGSIMKKDIIITACGVPGLITGEMVKEGAIIVDAGITRVGDKVVGDVDFGSVKNKVSYITPVPGGVGPVTIACLLENVYLAAKTRTDR